MNKFKYSYDDFEYNNKSYIRECHSVGGTHWHPILRDGGKSWELIYGTFLEELEEQYIRSKKLDRVLKNNNK